MGNQCCGPAGDANKHAASKNVDKTIEAKKKQSKKEQKLLLLGPGESGKSTIFKQIKIIHKKTFEDKNDRLQLRQVIRSNLLEGMQVLIKEMRDTYIDINMSSIQADDMANELEQLTNDFDEDLDWDAIGVKITTLWADQGIRDVYKKRSEFQLLDSANYFFERASVRPKEDFTDDNFRGNLLPICAPDYVPSQMDCLRSRARTAGIVEDKFQIGEVPFRLVDVGGQRTERKKWIHCFSDVTAVIFVASMSEYDQVLFEDQRQNRMQEALTLFDEICNNSRWFDKTDIILFLNKSDLFAEKILVRDLRCCFPDYDGGASYTRGTYYIKEQFMQKNKSPMSRSIYPHVTNATDTTQIKAVWKACKSIVLTKNLENAFM